MSVGDDESQGMHSHSCGGGVGTSAIKPFFLLILLFLSGSIILMSNPVVAELDETRLRSAVNSDVKYNYISQALERLHFGPFLRLRSISSRALSKQFVSDLPKSKEKKALSYLTRFYPLLQFNHGNQPSRSRSSLSLTSARRRISFPHSSETGTYPVGRFTRPIMRLRWGK